MPLEFADLLQEQTTARERMVAQLRNQRFRSHMDRRVGEPALPEVLNHRFLRDFWEDNPPLRPMMSNRERRIAMED